MESETVNKIQIIGFRHIAQDDEHTERISRMTLQSGLINVVIIQMGGIPQQKHKLKQLQQWLRQQKDIVLWKVTKKEAFVQIYREMMRDSRKSFFITNMLIEDLPQEPLQKMYQQLDKQGGLSNLHLEAQHNLSKIRFIIYKQSIEGIDKRNYFHAGIYLLTNQMAILKQTIKQELNSILKLQPKTSTSSINTEEAQIYGQSIGNVKEGIKIIQNQKEDSSSNLLGPIYNSPSVGKYDVTGFSKTGESNKFGKGPKSSKNLFLPSDLIPGPGQYDVQRFPK